jgi:hypothetical protein
VSSWLSLLFAPKPWTLNPDTALWSATDFWLPFRTSCQRRRAASVSCWHPCTHTHTHTTHAPTHTLRTHARTHAHTHHPRTHTNTQNARAHTHTTQPCIHHTQPSIQHTQTHTHRHAREAVVRFGAAGVSELLEVGTAWHPIKIQDQLVHQGHFVSLVVVSWTKRCQGFRV